MKQTLNHFCWTNNEYNHNLSKSNIINQKKGGIIFNKQKNLININRNKSEKQNLYYSRKIVNKNINIIPKAKYSNSGRLSKFYSDNSSSFNQKEFGIINKDTDYFLRDYNTLNRLSQNEGIHFSSQKNQNIKINKNKSIYICNVNCDNKEKIKDNKNY